MGGIEGDQNAMLVARNDFHSATLPLNLLLGGGLAGWAIALIVIGVLAVVAVAGYMIYLKMFKRRPNRESEAEKSLLEREGEVDDKDSDDDEE